MAVIYFAVSEFRLGYRVDTLKSRVLFIEPEPGLKKVKNVMDELGDVIAIILKSYEF